MPTEIPWAFFLCSSTQESSRPGLGFLGCKSAEDCKTILFFLLLAIFCTGFIFMGRKRRGTRRASGSKNCRRSQTLCFYCYFRSSATCVTFRFAEPRQSSSEPYIKKPSVAWDRGGLQGIFAEDALHRVPPSNKYIIAFEGA